MTITVAEVFDKHFSKVKFDSRLAKGIYQYQIGYINQNHEHLEFFGSNLLGVHVVRFKDSDVIRLFDDVLDIDYYDLVADIRRITTINHEFKISSDPFNLTCMYLIHRFMTSPVLGDKQRERAAYDAALIFFYRCIAAIQSYFFKYPTDPKIAQAAYSKLSNKYLIKKLGSWHKVMDYRANDLINKKSIHHKLLKTFNDDNGIVYAINDSQGRIRDLIKNYTAEFMKVHTDGENIGTNSGTYLDADGEETIKEKTKSVESSVNYVRQIISDKRSFIKDDLVRVIVKINSNTSSRMVKHTLSWLSDGYNDTKLNKQVDEFISMVVINSMFLIEHNIPSHQTRDYAFVLNNLKNLYLSTRSNDPDLIKIREMGEKLIKEANGKISNSLVLATRTSVILYIMLRVLAGK